MKLPLYKQVALLIDIPEKRLRKGDIVTIVEFVESPSAGLSNGYCVEAFNALGEMIAVFIVAEGDLEALTGHDMFSKRTLETVQ